MSTKLSLDTEWRNKNICILGFSREGISTYLWLQKNLKSVNLAIADQKTIEEFTQEEQKLLLSDPNLSLKLGRNYLDALKNYDIIVRSPGVPYSLSKRHSRKNGVITSQTKLFFHLFPGKIIGVTGTKGKSTTSSLIYQMLKLQRKVKFLGNIGIPPLQGLANSDKNTLAVMELSSHQLQDLDMSPHLAVLLNLYPEHLDYYENVNEYRKAKAKITKFQKPYDVLIFNAESNLLFPIIKQSRAKKKSFSLINSNRSDAFLQNDTIFVKEKNTIVPVCKKSETRLFGLFNTNNLMAAILTAREIGLSIANIRKAIMDFQPLPHRLELVTSATGILFINDSLSTIPESAVEAITACGKKLSTLLVGGFDRGIEQVPLVEAILKSRLKTILCFPETGEIIQRSLEKHRNNFDLQVVNSMEQAVGIARLKTEKGEICLLSPGAASFNLFKDYADRGDQFKYWIREFDTRKQSV